MVCFRYTNARTLYNSDNKYYNNNNFNDPVANDICRKCQEKLETI